MYFTILSTHFSFLNKNIYFLILNIYLFYVRVFACMSLCVPCVQCLCRPEEGIGSPRIGITGDWELPCWVMGTELRSSKRPASALNH